MHIIHIQNNNHNVLVRHSTEPIDILKQFFAPANQRNEELKTLIQQLQKDKEAEHHTLLPHQLHQ